jgi:hypothetical protein
MYNAVVAGLHIYVSTFLALPVDYCASPFSKTLLSSVLLPSS